ncbi:MAG TPA: hypothetical protein VFR11_02030 [Micromonosporaceae bacterium]|nr:hypothetical protein [Micromonosporaceae bacterium]
MSSLGDVRPESTVYQSRSAGTRHDGYYYAIIVSTLIAGFLTMLGCASVLAGIAGLVDLAMLGFVRTVSYLGLGLAGAGSGGLLLLVLGDLRRLPERQGLAESRAEPVRRP